MGDVGKLVNLKLKLLDKLDEMADAMEKNYTGMAMGLYREIIILKREIFGPGCEEDPGNPYVQIQDRIRSHRPSFREEYEAMKSDINELRLSLV
jgi:hypothetical protein